ncbi:hypothetical protein D623_10006106 [Myotis brandtii]|uniref:Uncharacterized protein n=1 Tax=Myotis brandtii TaxID=109478 RepID=S7MJZ5_MYOBR|nr:hypothetical protein D623_10006106 [Myotis brandtii]
MAGGIPAVNAFLVTLNRLAPLCRQPDGLPRASQPWRGSLMDCGSRRAAAPGCASTEPSRACLEEVHPPTPHRPLCPPTLGGPLLWILVTGQQ